jgi:hypothetical protein
MAASKATMNNMLANTTDIDWQQYYSALALT